MECIREMSFNSFTYYANKYARMARKELMAARKYKQEGRSDMVHHCLQLGRAYWRLSLSNRRQRQMQKEHGW
jgi:hypothetical protein